MAGREGERAGAERRLGWGRSARPEEVNKLAAPSEREGRERGRAAGAAPPLRCHHRVLCPNPAFASLASSDPVHLLSLESPHKASAAS